MFSITEQFSATTKSQLESQLKILNSLANTAVSGAEQVIALNLSATKASVEKSSSTAKQLFQAKDPQEFIKLSTAQPPSFESLLAYSNELFSIASKVQADLLRAATEQAQQAPVLPALKLAAPQPSAPVVVAASVAPANEPVAAPKVAKAKPATEPTPVAQAAAEVVAEAAEAPAASKPFPSAPPKPVAAAVAEPQPVALKSVTPAKGKPPVKTSTGPETKPAVEKQK
jgi:phasin family protein